MMKYQSDAEVSGSVEALCVHRLMLNIGWTLLFICRKHFRMLQATTQCFSMSYLGNYVTDVEVKLNNIYIYIYSIYSIYCIYIYFMFSVSTLWNHLLMTLPPYVSSVITNGNVFFSRP